MSRDCPDGELKTCFKCGGKGHIAMDCPSPANTTTEARGKKVGKGSGDTDGVGSYFIKTVLTNFYRHLAMWTQRTSELLECGLSKLNIFFDTKFAWWELDSSILDF